MADKLNVILIKIRTLVTGADTNSATYQGPEHLARVVAFCEQHVTLLVKGAHTIIA